MANSETHRTVWGVVLGALVAVVGIIVGAYAATHSLHEWDWTSIPMIVSYVLAVLAVISLFGLVLGWRFPCIKVDQPPPPLEEPEEEAPWRIEKAGIDWGARDKTAHYSLVNKSKSPKYGVSVAGTVMPPDGQIIKSWDMIPDGESEDFDVPDGKDVKQEFTVRWHRKPDKSDTVRTQKDKVRSPYK